MSTDRGGRSRALGLPLGEAAVPEPDRRNGHGDVPLPRTERPDAPAYLRLYLERRARGEGDDHRRGVDASRGPGSSVATDDGVDGSRLPLYLRRFREQASSHPDTRGAESNDTSPAKASSTAAAPAAGLPVAVPSVPGPDASTDGAGMESARAWTEPWAQTSRSPDLVLPPELRPPDEGVDQAVDVHLVRHGETQGYSANAGLTPMGRWQAQRRGLDLSKGVRDGQAVTIACAPTARATQTAEQIRRGVEDGVVLWGRGATVDGPLPMPEFRNFGVWTPSGEMDVTSAFREYHAVSERYERVALGDRPLWLVEIDRFYRLQMGGGDAIHFWMTVPLVSFEPPAAVVLRFWAGIAEVVRRTPSGGRVFVATHSGPMRAFAAWALGHDAGEPYNAEEVRVRVRRSLREAQVTYRNRTSEIQLPFLDARPSWWSERASATSGSAATVDTRRTQPC